MSLSESITKDLSAKINEHLPAAVGNELKIVLEKAEKDSKTVDKLTEELNFYKKEVSDRNDKISKLNENISKHSALNEREQAIKKKEDSLEIEILKLKLGFAENKLSTIENLVMTVFRNPQKVTTINGGSSIPYRDQYGNQNSQYSAKNEIITESEQ